MSAPWNLGSNSGITADMLWLQHKLRLKLKLKLLLWSLLTGSLLLAGCGDGDIRKGCKNYCKCHRGDDSDSACRKRCSKRLTALKKRDRPQARQIADCLASKGERKCSELAACAGSLLKSK